MKHNYAILRFATGAKPSAATGYADADVILNAIARQSAVARGVPGGGVTLYAEDGLAVVDVIQRDFAQMYIPICHPRLSGSSRALFDELSNAHAKFRELLGLYLGNEAIAERDVNGQ